MNSEFPIVTIITVSYNCRNLIEATIVSVLRQDYPKIEYIVIDGGSTDGTMEVIAKYQEHIHLVISEKDTGIYDAMNKGLQNACGDIVYFLNCGDHLFNTRTVKTIVTTFVEHPDCSLVYGDVENYIEGTVTYDSQYRCHKIQYFSRTLCHQTIFSKKSLFDTTGGFDTGYSIFADRDWLFRTVFLYDVKIQYIPIPICRYLFGGFSSRYNREFYQERARLYWNYLKERKILVPLILHPKELFLIAGIFLYSIVYGVVFDFLTNSEKM